MAEQEIPYYRVRHMVQPGITGWAQVQYKYGNTLDDAREKLQYDLFYIKNASSGSGFADHVPDHQDRAAGPGGAMKMGILVAATGLIAYTYVGYVACFMVACAPVPMAGASCAARAVHFHSDGGAERGVDHR